MRNPLPVWSVVAAVVVVGVAAVRVLVTGVLDAMLGEHGVAAEGSMVVVSASFTPSATHTCLELAGGSALGSPSSVT